ncbi:MAG: PQQ-dependent sugar dehydrogenase [Ferruginibacter sp.]|nr:PQQ-dependent sugar dehydrogenase [Ferruginibacter sp.]
MMYRNIFLMFIFFVLLCSGSKCSSTVQSNGSNEASADSVKTILKGLNYPWEILWGKDDYIWMTEREGKISKVDPVTGKIIFSASIAEVESRNEGGMLGMVQHPDFLTNGLFYVVYNYESSNGYREKMVQMKFENGSIKPGKTLIENIPASSIHNGSRLWIDNDKIFMTTGDAANQPNAQRTTSFSGKVLRFNLDGSIPADNPFPGSVVWSYGHRNQQGLVVANGIMYASEHGPNEEDEINIVEKKRNYGWPAVNGPCDENGEKTFCDANNVKEPIWSSGNNTLAVCGMDYYSSNLIPAWNNSLLMCTLKDASLRVLTLSKDGLSVTSPKTFFKNRFGRLRDICISPAGKVYICTSNGGNEDLLVEISKP